jgi:uncharacterized protein YndB with AHSA1/START domain
VADVLQDFPIAAPASQIFAAISTPAGLDQWWTLTSSGSPIEGSDYVLDFGPEYQWRARVVRSVPDQAFELELTSAMPDWLGTRVSFALEDLGGRTWVRFTHTGWPDAGEHYRTSSHCWALYLRILRRFVEHGETVPYAERLSV